MEEEIVETEELAIEETGEVNLTSKFASRDQSMQYKDLDAALEASSQLNLTSIEGKLSDIELLPEYKIRYAGTDRKITQNGFISFLKILGMSYKFASNIPLDLLLDNVTRIINDKNSQPITVIMRASGDIVNIVKGNLKESSSFDVLSALSLSGTIKYVDLSETFMKLCIQYPDSIKVKDDDELFISSFVTNYPAGGKRLTMTSGLYRTACENSFIMNVLGKVTAKFSDDKDLRLSKFVSSVSVCDSIIYDSLRSKSSKLRGGLTFFDFEVRKLWKNVNKYLDPVATDAILGISGEDERNLLFATVALREKSNKRARLLGESVDEALLTNISVYDTLNKLTLHAHTNLVGESRHALEVLGGQWLGSILLN